MGKSDIVIYKVTDSNTAALINRGAKLKRGEKILKMRIDDIKEKLQVLQAGKHVTNKGCYVTISETDDLLPPDPKATRRLMTKMGIGKFFIEVVAVQIKLLQDYLGNEEIQSLRVKNSEDKKRKYNFGSL